MAFQLTSIAGSMSAAQLAQQASTAEEQDKARVYRQELTKELARHAQQTEEEVSAANQEGHRRIGDRPPQQRKRRGTPHHEPEPEPAVDPADDFGQAEPHMLDVRDDDTAPDQPPTPPGHVDLTA